MFLLAVGIDKLLAETDPILKFLFKSCLERIILDENIHRLEQPGHILEVLLSNRPQQSATSSHDLTHVGIVAGALIDSVKDLLDDTFGRFKIPLEAG